MRAPAIIALIAATTLTGCVTRLDVRPATTQDVEGTRYSLPKPLLMATPQSDGTVAFSWQYVPDDERTYAIASSVVMAKDHTTITLDNGLLKKISFHPDSTDVTTQFINSSTEVAKARLKALDDARAAAQKKADDAAAAIQTARNDVRDAKTAVAKIEAEIAALKATDQNDKVPDAEVRLAEAQVDLAAKQQKLNDLLAAGGTVGGGVVGAGNVTETKSQQPTTPVSFKPAPGPVFFEIVEELTPVHKVKLVAINEQGTFGTSDKLPTRAQFTVKSGAVALQPATQAESGSPFHVTIESSVPLNSIDSAGAVLQDAATKALKQEFFQTAVLTTRTEIDVSLAPNTPSGTYHLAIPFTTDTGKSPFDMEATFVIHNPPPPASQPKKKPKK